MTDTKAGAETKTKKLTAQERRDARKAELQQQANAQRELDLEALDALEIEHGDSNVKALSVPYTPGLPTMCACRTPRPEEIKRYRARVKPDSKGRTGDPTAAAEELATVVRIYPADAETYAKMCEARPGLHVHLGIASIELSVGEAESEAKN